MKIGAKVLEAMSEQARAEFPDECCGVLVATPDGGLQVYPIRNIQNEMHAADPERYPRTARIAYAGHAGDLRKALQASEVEGCSLAAFYHSHPDHPAYFSEEDIAQATPFGEPSYPDAAQIVVSVYGSEIRDIKVFRWSPEAETYVETALNGAT